VSSELYAVCDNKQKDFVVKNPIIVKKSIGLELVKEEE